MSTLVIDIGGSGAKLGVWSGKKLATYDKLKIKSLTPGRLIDELGKLSLTYKRVSVGVPAPVKNGVVLAEPANLGPGWTKFDYQTAFGCNVKLVNDAAMQALGSFRIFRPLYSINGKLDATMLFLGLGTGLGTAIVSESYYLPMEAGHLPFKKGKSFEYYVGTDALKRDGKSKWVKNVHDMVKVMEKAFNPDFVVLGGGNARRYHCQGIPGNCPLYFGDNDYAFHGGLEMW